MNGNLAQNAVADGAQPRRTSRRLIFSTVLAAGTLFGATALPALASASARHSSTHHSAKKKATAKKKKAQPKLDFYKGKTVTILVPNAPGGNIDVTARTAAPYLQSALGAAGVKVTDVTGAGGVVGLDQLWNTPSDGLTMGYTNVPVSLLTSIVGGKGIQYHAGLFTYLGRSTAAPRILAVSYQSGITSVSQLAGKTLKVPSQGFDDSFFTMAALGKSLGFTPQFVTGFANQAAQTTSIGTGATDVMEGSLASLMPAISAHLIRPIMFETNARVPSQYKNLPQWANVKKLKDPKLVAAFTNLVSIEGSFFFAPHTPLNAVNSARAGIRKMFLNPAFKAAEKKAGAELDFLDGKDEQVQVRRLLANIKPFIPLLQAEKKAVAGS